MTAPAVSAAAEAVARFMFMTEDVGGLSILGTTVLDARVEFQAEHLDEEQYHGMIVYRLSMDGMELVKVVVIDTSDGRARAASVLGGVLHHWL